MKKSVLILLLPASLCFSCTKEEKVTHQYLVSTITEHCDGFDTVESFDYDDQNRVIKDKNEIIYLDNGVVSEISYYYTTYEYFDNGELKKESSYTLEDGADVLQEYSEYTLENNLPFLRQNYQKQTSGNIILRNKSEYVYDSLGRLIKETLYHTKDSTPDTEISLFKSYVYEYSYFDNSNLKSSKTTSEFKEDESLMSVNKIVYTYENNNLIKEDEYYGKTLDTLKHDEQKVYNYSKNNLISVIRYDVNDGVFVKEKQKDYTYDSRNRNSKIIETSYDEDSGEADYIITTIFEFDKNNCITRKTSTDFDVASNTSYINLDEFYTYVLAK